MWSIITRSKNYLYIGRKLYVSKSIHKGSFHVCLVAKTSPQCSKNITSATISTSKNFWLRKAYQYSNSLLLTHHKRVHTFLLLTATSTATIRILAIAIVALTISTSSTTFNTSSGGGSVGGGGWVLTHKLLHIELALATLKSEVGKMFVTKQ